MDYSPEHGQGTVDSSGGIVEERIVGYDELFEPPVQSDHECPICKMCLRDPVQTECGHHFCKSCIQRHMR